MNWSHVHLIFMRELRDQLRDRRTMFTVLGLPMLLYPLMGLVLMQMAQFSQPPLLRVEVLGLEQWPDAPPLADDQGRLLAAWEPAVGHGLRLSSSPHAALWQDPDAAAARAAELLRGQLVDLVVLLPPSGAEAEALGSSRTKLGRPPLHHGRVQVFHDASSERSQLAVKSWQTLLHLWHQAWSRQTLIEQGLEPAWLAPLPLDWLDVSPQGVMREVVWSKLLPFVMLIWALTGAFYPAIDLCAGEKERGTLETLLCSPARRREIVWGKLLTVMCFSVGTSLLNLLSLQLTTSVLIPSSMTDQLMSGGSIMGPLPLSSLGWLVMMLIPMAALFSALALAVAALARSSKEGQYYLMPLILAGMPLVMLPMMPGMGLNLGTSLIPVTGAVLLARTLIEQQWQLAGLHLPTVIVVTAGCCLLSIRWAVRQFESESVMFRHGERLGISGWLQQLWQQRGVTASAAEAILCGLIILLSVFFARVLASHTDITWEGLARDTLMLQVGLILAPAVLMAIFLTRSTAEALRLGRPRGSEVLMAAWLAISFHPLYVGALSLIEQLYPLGESTQHLVRTVELTVAAAPWTSVLICLVLLPAVCEELAFRGFIFGGLLQHRGTLRAVLLSSLLFGLIHGLIQQSIAAGLLGLLLGWVAVRTGSVIPCIVLHALHNLTGIVIIRQVHAAESPPTWFEGLVEVAADGRWSYSSGSTSAALIASLVPLIYFSWKRSRPASPPE
jgi:sodium transport system permease protein